MHVRRLSLLLWPVGHEPVELRPGERAYIGRHPCNDLTLFDMSASRFHAVLEWRMGAPRPEVRDRGSGNGTWVDGQRLAPEGPAHVLSGDERLRFGSLDVRLELRCDGEPAPALLPELDDAVVLFTDAGGNVSDYAFDRQAVQRALLDLEQAGRTGTLRFQSDGFGATLTWCLGKVIAAESGTRDDPEAVVARVLESRQGAYTFSRAFEPVEASLNLSIAEVLRTDQEETRRHAKVVLEDDQTGRFAAPAELRDNALEDSARYDLGAIAPVDFAFDLYAPEAPAPAPAQPVPPTSGAFTFDLSDVLDAPVFDDGSIADDEFVIDLAELGLEAHQVWSA